MTISNLIASEVERNYTTQTESEIENNKKNFQSPNNQEEEQIQENEMITDPILPLNQISDINTPLRGVETPNRQPRSSTF